MFSRRETGCTSHFLFSSIALRSNADPTKLSHYTQVGIQITQRNIVNSRSSYPLPEIDQQVKLRDGRSSGAGGAGGRGGNAKNKQNGISVILRMICSSKNHVNVSHQPFHYIIR